MTKLNYSEYKINNDDDLWKCSDSGQFTSDDLNNNPNLCGLKNDNGSIDINTDCTNPYSINFSNTNCSSYSGTYRSCIEDGPNRGNCRHR